MKYLNFQLLTFSFQLLLLWLLTFVLGKLAFIVICHGGETMAVADVAAILWHGLPMDLSTTAYLLMLPWLCCWIASTRPATWRPLRCVLLVFHALASLAIVACILGDIALYPFWGFKLDATIWTYIDSPKDVVASVSTAFVLLVTFLFASLSVLLFWLLSRALPQEIAAAHSALRGRVGERLLRGGLCHLGFVCVGIVLMIILRGGITESTMNVGNAYFSDRQFLNHAAVNPAFSLLASSQKTEHFNQLYRAMTDEEATRVLEGLYPTVHGDSKCIVHSAEVHSDTFDNGKSASQQSLCTMHSSTLHLKESPSILLIIWEGCGGPLTASLGGPTGSAAITPHLDHLARMGIFFSELRANSFRTDRGVLSTLSGHIAYPTHSLMKMAMRASHLPSLARSLGNAGYTTSFIYGGDINFTNMKGYLLSTGYQHVTSDADFTLAERSTSKWGVCDSILFLRLYEQMVNGQWRNGKFFTTALTLSSHEPWDVPATFHRTGDPDEKVASFRYTDYHLGRFIRQLQDTALWDDLLVIILPDHGVLAADVLSWQDPRFFHIPMVWTGGAIDRPAVISALMNQSDLAATLLARLGLPHDDFPWSRDILSPQYTRPFTYSSFNDGFAITAPSTADSTCTTVFYDNKAQSATIHGDKQLQDSLVRVGKAIQQRSYDRLSQ